MERFTRLVLAQDRLGHRFNLNYKGKESYNTWFGTLLSLVVNLLVLTIFLDKATEVFNMNDPDVSVNSRPLFKEELEEIGEINLKDALMDLSVYVFDIDSAGKQIKKP